MRHEPVKLHFLCGKMAAGKSNFAKKLAQAKNAVLLVQDELLGASGFERLLKLSMGSMSCTS